MIEKNTPILIRHVANKFIVENNCEIRIRHGEILISPNEKIVFQTFAELQSWLENHFSHRNTSVISDE